MDSSDHIYDPRDLAGWICVVEKGKISFRVLLDFKNRILDFLKKRTLGESLGSLKKGEVKVNKNFLEHHAPES